MTSKRKSRWFEIIIGLVLLSIPAGLMFGEIRDMLAAPNWSSVDGELIPVGKSGIAAYQYEVNGTTYKNGRLYFFERLRFSPDRQGADLRKQYQQRVGQPITVYYDPHHPHRAVIFRDDLNLSWPIVCCGSLIYLAVLGWVIRLLRQAVT